MTFTVATLVGCMIVGVLGHFVSKYFVANPALRNKIKNVSNLEILESHSEAECGIESLKYGARGFAFSNHKKSCRMFKKCIRENDEELIDETTWEQFCRETHEKVINTQRALQSLSAYGILPEPSDILRFEFRGPMDAFLHLYSNETHVYSIGIGRGANTWSSIENCINTTSCVDGYVGTTINRIIFERNLLSDKHYRKFWISWNKKEVILGKGNVYDRERLLTLRKLAPNIVNEIKLISAMNSSWILKYE